MIILDDVVDAVKQPPTASATINIARLDCRGAEFELIHGMRRVSQQFFMGHVGWRVVLVKVVVPVV